MIFKNIPGNPYPAWVTDSPDFTAIVGNDYYAMLNWLDRHCQKQYYVSRGPGKDEIRVKFEDAVDANFFTLKWGN